MAKRKIKLNIYKIYNNDFCICDANKILLEFTKQGVEATGYLKESGLILE